MPYNGFRLLRFATSRVADVEREVARIYAVEGEAPPPLRRDALDHDVWYCRAVKPCARCAARIALDTEPEGGIARVASVL